MVKDPSAFRCILMAAEDSYRLERPRRVRKEPKGLRESGLAPRADVGLQDGVWDSCSAERHLALSKARSKPPSPLLCRRQKGVRRWLVGLSFRFPRDHGQSLSLFSYMGKQTKPICLPGKGCSGLCRKASIGRRFLVSRSNLGVLFCLERHPGRMSLDLKLSLKPIRPNTDLFSRRF